MLAIIGHLPSRRTRLTVDALLHHLEQVLAVHAARIRRRLGEDTVALPVLT
jgi:hypothetical protein